MTTRPPLLQTLTGKVTALGVVALAVILIAASVVLATIRALDQIVTHLADETVSEVALSEAYAVDITRGTAELQSFLRDAKASELQEADAALVRAGQSVAAIEALHRAHAAADDVRDLGSLNGERGVIAGELGAIAGALRSGEAADERDGFAEQLEGVEDRLADLRVEGNEVLAADRASIAVRVSQAIGGAMASVTTLVLFSLALMAGAVAVLRSQIIGPVTALASAAGLVAEARLGQRVDETGWDEIGQLQRSFNTMAGTLEARDAALAEQVARAERARSEAEHARGELQAQLATVAEQRELIGNLSLPILPVDGDTLVMPLIGTLDAQRMETALGQALGAVERSGARYVLLDVTGVPVVDSGVAQGIRTLMQAVQLLGAELVLVGIRPEVAQTMVSYAIDITQVETRASLADGIASVRARRAARGRTTQGAARRAEG